jgi:hypothetical protein
MPFRIRPALALVGGASLLVAAWLAWSSSDGRFRGSQATTKGAASAVVDRGPAEHAASVPGKLRVESRATTRELTIDRAPVAPGTFRIGSNVPSKGDGRLDAKSRDMASKRWEAFLHAAHPTEEQQQAILSAIYDAQLYYVEVRRVEGEWASEWAQRGDESESGPMPESSWTWMDEVTESVSSRAKEVLSPEQFSHWSLMEAPVLLAVPARWVEPTNPPRL